MDALDGDGSPGRPPVGTAPQASPQPAAQSAPRAGLQVVVGAAGVTGRRVVAQLHAAGSRVRAVPRDGRDVGTPAPGGPRRTNGTAPP